MPKSRLLEATDRLSRAVVAGDKNTALRALVDVREASEELTRTVSGLPSVKQYGTIETMPQLQTVLEPQKRRRGVRLRSTGPVARVAKLLGVSVAELARRLDENYQSCRTWDSRGPVPGDVKLKLDALVKAHKTPAKPARK